MTFLSPVQPAGIVPAGLRDTRDRLYRDAWDHTDLGEYSAAIMEAAALVVRLRQIAAECSRATPLLEFAEAIEDAGGALESEARRWDDERDGRNAGNRLDTSRAWHPSALAAE